MPEMKPRDIRTFKKGEVAPQRSERDMLVELLELSRGAAANIDWSRKVLTTLLKGVDRLTSQAGAGARIADVRNYLDTWLGLDASWRASGSEALRRFAEVTAAGSEGTSAEERAARASLIREILEEKEGGVGHGEEGGR